MHYTMNNLLSKLNYSDSFRFRRVYYMNEPHTKMRMILDATAACTFRLISVNHYSDIDIFTQQSDPTYCGWEIQDESEDYANKS